MNFKPESHPEGIDPHTIQFIFPELNGEAIAKLSVMHIGDRQFYRELGWGRSIGNLSTASARGARGRMSLLCNPIQLYALNKAVEFMSYLTNLNPAKTGWTELYCSAGQALLEQ